MTDLDKDALEQAVRAFVFPEDTGFGAEDQRYGVSNFVHHNLQYPHLVRAITEMRDDAGNVLARVKL